MAIWACFGSKSSEVRILPLRLTLIKQDAGVGKMDKPLLFQGRDCGFDPRRQYTRLVLLVLIERIETNFILIKTNFVGIAKATANKFNPA